MTFTAHTSIGVGVATRKILIVQSGLFQPTLDGNQAFLHAVYQEPIIDF